MKDLLRQLVEAWGPSGHEAQVRALIEGLAQGAADELRTDAMGNLIALKKGTGGGKRIMIAAHMDEIGLIVTYVDAKGFARVGRVGGVFLPTVIGRQVRFGNGALGVVSREKWLTNTNSLPKWEEVFVDLGAASKEGLKVGVGDAAAFVQPFADFGQRVACKAMDDRAGCAVALQTLLTMDAGPNDVYFVFTVQEEVGLRGALTSAFGVEPEIGLAVDVTDTGDTPESEHMAVALGHGPAVKVMDSGLVAHPGVVDWMTRAAEAQGIPYQREVLLLGGTDAQAIQRSRAGVPAGCLSIPTRYVHTPSEMVDMGDMENAVRLLTALVTGPVAI